MSKERDELFEADRGERKFYESLRSLKQPIKMPITRDGIEALLEIVTKSLEVPLDDKLRQVFCGMIHHIDNGTKTTSLGNVGDYIWKHYANNATWLLDQEAKVRLAEEAARLKTEEARLASKAEAEKPTIKVVGGEGKEHSLT